LYGTVQKLNVPPLTWLIRQSGINLCMWKVIAAIAMLVGRSVHVFYRDRRKGLQQDGTTNRPMEPLLQPGHSNEEVTPDRR
jgi:hypothetical protein